MTPLPPRPTPPPPPPVLPYPVAQAVERFITGGPRRGRQVLHCHCCPRPISFQAERALRTRESDVVYTNTGLPLVRVDREPRRGEYRFHADEGVVEPSAEDSREHLTIRTPVR